MAESKQPRSRWSAERRARFLETLALTSNVSASERAAEMPPSSAYKERNRDPEFHAAWEQALHEGYDRLELQLLQRAIKGQRKPVRDKGKIVGYNTEFSEKLALTLLGVHRQNVRGGARQAQESAAAFHRRIAAKLAAARRTADDA